jgi:hypothetical protein
MPKPSALPEDLDPYTAAPEADLLGLTPLGVGWLTRQRPFATGPVPADFVAHLLRFCEAGKVVYAWPRPQPCPFCGALAPSEIDGLPYTPGLGEIRVIGEEEIFAAPSLIYHYVVAHQYKPPAEFIAAVRHGPQPGTAEYEALWRSLR